MSSYTITPSTELMENYRQTTVMAPEQQLQALQDRNGHLLLFSVGSDHAGAPLNLTAEVPGDRHGWRTLPLTAGLAGPCRHFSAAQRRDGSIHLAAVIRSGKDDSASDALYLGELPAAASADLVAPSWTAVAYDDPDTPRPRLVIAGVSSSEASTGGYVIADVVRHPESAGQQIVRYFIDPSRPSGHAWRLHDVPVDVDAGGYASVVGRKGGAGIDGVYVSGQVNGKPQLVYTPLLNELRPGSHPLSAYLKLTAAGDLVADAVATCRLPDDSTDLYAAARGVLYRFTSTNQGHGAVAVPVVTSPAFTGVTDMFASHDPATDAVTVWGRNADNAIVATTYAVDVHTQQKSWSLPLPLLTGVQQVSPLLNRSDGANTIVAHTAGDELRVGVKTPGLGHWTWRPVTLPPASTTAPAEKINSYTTKVEVRNEHGQAATRVKIAITAPTRTSVHINHLYYVVGPTAIHADTDAAGTITIVEAVPRLTGTRFSFAVAADPATKPVQVNPMDKPFKTAAGLSTVAGLRDAKIISYVDGKRMPPRDLLKPGLDESTLQRVAALNQQCAAIYADPQQAPGPSLLAAASFTAAPFDVPLDAPVVGAGDLFQHLEAATSAGRLHGTEAGGLAAGESFWQMLVRWFEDAWEFVVKIGEAIYRCILTVIEDVVSAIRWVFDKIVKAIGDLIEFLRFLFEWDDFKRTKDVIKNLTVSFFRHQCDQIAVARREFDGAVDTVIEEINAWAGIDSISGPGGVGAGRLASQATAEGPSAPGALLGHHLQGNLSQADGQGSGGPPAAPTSVVEALITAAEGAYRGLADTYDDLKSLVDKAVDLSLVQILKEIVGILAKAVLKELKVAVDLLLDVLQLVIRAALDLLDTPVHIPVVSDILNAVGVPDFSMLDASCWVAAVPITIAYKIAAAVAGYERKTLFPDTAETRFLIETTDFPTIAAAFAPRLQSSSGEDSRGEPSDQLFPMSPEAANIVFWTLHGTAGVCGILSAYVDMKDVILPTHEVPRWVNVISAASAFVGGLSRAIANVLVPRYPETNDWIKGFSTTCSVLFIGNKLVWALAAWADQDKNKDREEPPHDFRAAGSIVDALLVIPSFAVTCVHFAHLAEQPADRIRAVAIIDETSFVCTYIARVLYTVVVTGLIKNPEAELVAVAFMSGSEVVHGVLQLSEIAVYGDGKP